MDFFNKLGKKASETYQVTKEKTVKFSNEVKLKGKISDVKANINQVYKEIGELVYEQFKNNTDKKEDIELKCQVIANLNDEISKLESEILALKETKKCISCGEEIDSKADFCPKCGKEQPKVEEEEKIEVKDEVDEEVKDAEVTEIKDVENNEKENDE